MLKRWNRELNLAKISINTVATTTRPAVTAAINSWLCSEPLNFSADQFVIYGGEKSKRYAVMFKGPGGLGSWEYLGAPRGPCKGISRRSKKESPGALMRAMGSPRGP